MLKRLLKISMLTCALTLTCATFAQNDSQAKFDYPRYGFWSNWSLGGIVGADYQSGINNTNSTNPVGGWGWGAKLIAKKQLNWDWALRLTAGAPMMPHLGGQDGYMSTTLGFEYSIINACNWNPDRKGDLYLFLEGGAGWKLGNSQANRQNGNFGTTALYAALGIGGSVNIGEHSSLFAEASVENQADIPSPVAHGLYTGQIDCFLGLGYMYNFGPTAVDQELLNQKAQLTLENFDALNNQIGDLQNQLATSKKAEQKLNNQVADLEKQLRNRPDKINNGEADSLRNVINQIKDDQLTFYALPFSVLYPVDVWRIPADQMEKVKACARVMKDNPNVKFNLVGFCDYSGSDDYNWKLSQKRAEEVKRVLVEKYGIEESRISCDWKGKTMAFGDLNYSVNRRTSFYRVID